MEKSSGFGVSRYIHIRMSTQAQQHMFAHLQGKAPL